MAFNPIRFSLAVDTIGGQSIRIYFYRSQDAQELVYGAGYFTDIAKHGAQVNDIIIVSDLQNVGVTYNTVVSAIDSHGNATVVAPPEIATVEALVQEALGYRNEAEGFAGAAAGSATAAQEILDDVEAEGRTHGR